MRKALFVVTLVVFFIAGYIAGSVQTRNSMALELGALTGIGGTVDSLKNLGTTIVEMEKNVSKLQENINSVKQVRENVSRYTGVYDQVMGVEGQKPAVKETVPTKDLPVSPDLQKGIGDMLK